MYFNAVSSGTSSKIKLSADDMIVLHGAQKSANMTEDLKRISKWANQSKRSTKNYVLNLYSTDASLEDSAHFTKYNQKSKLPFYDNPEKKLTWYYP